MKKFLLFTMTLCAMVIFSACTKNNDNDNELVGTWEQAIEQHGVKAVVLYTFNDDGTMTEISEITSDEPRVNIKGESTCEYTYEDGTITFKISPDDIKFSVFEIEGMSQQEIETSMEMQKQQMADIEQKLENVEIDGDELTCNFNGQKIKLTRK